MGWVSCCPITEISEDPDYQTFKSLNCSKLQPKIRSSEVPILRTGLGILLFIQNVYWKLITHCTKFRVRTRMKTLSEYVMLAFKIFLYLAFLCIRLQKITAPLEMGRGQRRHFKQKILWSKICSRKQREVNYEQINSRVCKHGKMRVMCDAVSFTNTIHNP
jgi:hypothetical protein